MISNLSATWTYLINDDPFGYFHNMFSLGNIGILFVNVILRPVIGIGLLFNRI